MLGVAAIVSLMWTLLMRVLGGFMIWLSLLLLVVGLTCGGIFAFMRYEHLRAAGAIDDFSFQPQLRIYFEMPRTWLIIGRRAQDASEYSPPTCFLADQRRSCFLAIAAAVALAFTLLVLCMIGSRLRLAIALIGETSRALGHMPSTLLFPLLPFLVHLLNFALWGTIAVYVRATGLGGSIGALHRRQFLRIQAKATFSSLFLAV